MKKYVLDLKVSSVERVNARNVLIKLTDEKPLPEMLPGQFVEVRVTARLLPFFAVLFLLILLIKSVMSCGCLLQL